MIILGLSKDYINGYWPKKSKLGKMCMFICNQHKIFQRRQDGSDNFMRNWTDYEFAFGSPASEV